MNKETEKPKKKPYAQEGTASPSKTSILRECGGTILRASSVSQRYFREQEYGLRGVAEALSIKRELGGRDDPPEKPPTTAFESEKWGKEVA